MNKYRPVPDEIISQMVEEKFKRQYSPQLGRRVFVLKKWLDKPLFEKYKHLFGHLDIGWTVKYPRHLARVLITEKVWESDEDW